MNYDNANDIIDEQYFVSKMSHKKFKCGKSYIEFSDGQKTRKQQQIRKIKRINVFNLQQLLHQIMEKLSGPLPPPPIQKKKNQILNHSNIKYNWDGIKYTSKIDG